MINDDVIANELCKPVKQYVQKVSNRRLVWAATAIVISKTKREKKESLR